MPGLLSADDLDRVQLDGLMAAARELTASVQTARHADKVVALLFFSDSLRTRVGFEVAAARLGAAAPVVSAARHTSVMSEPESLDDTVRSLAGWCDAICLRHPADGAAQHAADLVDVPVINCGDGQHEHPTQALVDLFAIDSLMGGIDGVTVVMVGDLHAMRAAHSLAIGLSRYRNVTLRCVAPRGLELPPRFADAFRRGGGALEESDHLRLNDADILYAAGLPALTAVGRLSGEARTAYVIDAQVAARLPARARILCPLPRIDEITGDVDVLPQAAYFLQSRLALGIRMAALDRALARR